MSAAEATKAPEISAKYAADDRREYTMRWTAGMAWFALTFASGAACADTTEPFASHRAAYEISLLSENTSRPTGAQTPVAATGLIAYEFRGSACEGYASTFRQVTQLQRSEGDPVATDIQAVTFEDGDAKSLRFQIDTSSGGSAEPPVSGSAAHGDDGALNVELRKPNKQKVALGKNVLFPTQHVEAIIAKAKEEATTMEARVYDGSDSGRKVFATLTVIGKAEHRAQCRFRCRSRARESPPLAGFGFVLRRRDKRCSARICAFLRSL